MKFRHTTVGAFVALSVSATVALMATSLLSASCTRSQGGSSADEFAYLYKDLPFEMDMVSRPSVPDRSVFLSDFGGNGNGIASNTQAFKDAIEHLSSKGGGHLIVPQGIWYTGPIELKSCIDLHVDPLAVIIFDPDPTLYPIVNSVFEGLDTKRCDAPIHADNAHDISITGGGVIDGNGGAWRGVKKSKVNSAEWKSFLAKGGILNEKGDFWYPSESFRKGYEMSGMNVPPKELDDAGYEEIRDFLRPELVCFRSCDNVLLEDCVFQNSPSWNLHPLQCRNVIIKGVTVRNPHYSQNGDGIDLDSCVGSVIIDSSFDVGDDGICIKSGKDEDGRRRAAPCKGLIVNNCTVYHGHGGFVVGSEMSGGVEDMKVSDCRFLGTDVGLRFKSCRGRGGVVKNIYIENIYMTDIVAETVLFDLHYNGKSAVEAQADGQAPTVESFPVDETTPAFRDIWVKDVVCNGAGRAMYFNGIPEMPVRNINIDRCAIKSDKGIEINWAEDVTMTGVEISAASGDPVKTSNVKNISIQ